MKVCLVNPPWEEGGRWGIRAGCRFPNLMPKGHNSYVPFPFLLAYTASVLEREGVEVLLIDGVAERCTIASFYDRVRSFAPHLIVAETAATSLYYDLEVLDALKTHSGTPHLAIYGPHVSAIPEDGLACDAVDFVIVGEPELTVLELARTISRKEDHRHIRGLAFKDGPCGAQVNPRRPLIPDLDALPYPRRIGMPMDRYNVPGFPPRVVFMYGSRGCPARCNFCLWPQTIFERGNYRSRAPERVVDEMVWVMEHCPDTRSFFFDDDTFNIGRARLLRFADVMKERKLKVPWGMNARADGWDAELLERLAETGLFTLRIGIESGDQEILNRSGKAIDLEEAMKTLRLSSALGISNHVSFMVGLAGESRESVERTILFARSAPVESIQFSVAVPFPGTSYYRMVEENGLLINRDLRAYNGSDNAVMRTECMSASEIGEAVRNARRRVYFSPRFIMGRLRYIRDTRDLEAIARKACHLLFRH